MIWWVGIQNSWIVITFGVDGIIDSISSELIFLLIFIIFVLGTSFTLLFRDQVIIRRTYLVGFFTILIVVNLVGLQMFPFIHLHKFTASADDEMTFHEVRVVDENGNELIYDGRATAHFDEFQMQQIGESLANEYSDAEADRAARHLLEQAIEYREVVEKGGEWHQNLRFPRHTRDYHWTSEEVASLEEFESIRVYKVTVDGSSGHDDVRVVEETREYELDTGVAS